MVIKITSETEAKIIRKFVFPEYKTFQRIFFNEDCTLLFQELENKRIVLYEWF